MVRMTFSAEEKLRFCRKTFQYFSPSYASEPDSFLIDQNPYSKYSTRLQATNEEFSLAKQSFKKKVIFFIWVQSRVRVNLDVKIEIC